MILPMAATIRTAVKSAEPDNKWQQRRENWSKNHKSIEYTGKPYGIGRA